MILASPQGSTLNNPLRFTYAPWIIRDGVKRLALARPIDSYEYGTTWESWDPENHPRWQPGLICSPRSGLIVLDIDDASKIPAGFPIPLDGPRASTGRGMHYYFDGRGLGPGGWPRQHHFPWGDVKSNGFAAAPGSYHPNGKRYTLVGGF